MDQVMEKVMLLMQRRLNCIREISNLTRELEEPLQRNDQVSALLILRERADEMAKVDTCQEELIKLGKTSVEAGEAVARLLARPPQTPPDSAGQEEKKAYEIAVNSVCLIKEIRRIDERLNRRVAGDKTFYK